MPKFICVKIVGKECEGNLVCESKAETLPKLGY